MTDDASRDDSTTTDDSTATDDSITMDDSTTPADVTPADATPADDEAAGDGTFRRLSAGDARGLLDRVGLGALVLLALVAGWSVYDQTGEAIRLWVDPAFQPVVLAAFNLAILLVALAGITHQLVRIRGE
jgi:hypothetical protein